MTRRDKTIICKDCGKDFMFRGEEQDFFAEKDYDEPIRCKDCRIVRKNNAAMKNDRAPRSGGFGGGGVQREMFPVTCAECGKQTQVPFRPRGDKPVYCSDCFSTKR